MEDVLHVTHVVQESRSFEITHHIGRARDAHDLFEILSLSSQLSIDSASDGSSLYCKTVVFNP